MAVIDLWRGRDGKPTARDGRGRRYRVEVPGHPTKSFHAKRDAQQWERELMGRGLRRGGTINVGELVKLWLAGKEGLSRRGYRACRGDASHVRGRWEYVAAGDVARHEVQAWLAGLTVTVRRRDAAGESREVTKPASEALRRRLLQCLAGALQIAVEQDVIERNPCDGVRVPRDHRREPRFLSVAEVGRLADAAGERYAPMVRLLATSGLRIGEAAALSVGDVDVQRRRVRVRQAKGLRGRDVPVLASVLAVLPLAERDAGDPLFTNRDGGRVDVDHFRSRVWRRALAEAGLIGTRIHDLRHTAASLAIASGADVKAVQSMLGHKSATLTLDTYGHLLDSRLDDVAARLDAMFTDSLPEVAD